MVKKVFAENGVVVAVAVEVGDGVRISAGGGAVPVDTVRDDVAVEPGWRVTEGANGLEFIAPTPTPPTLGPNQFYFLWTVQEQIALETIRESDTGVKVFMRRLDDPRTTEVVLSDPTVQEAVRHTVAALVKAGVVKEEDADTRAATIIAGGRL